MSTKGSLQPSPNEYIARTMYRRYNRCYKFMQFLQKVKIGAPNDCWEWQGGCGTYGIFNWHEKGISNAHVASYVLFNGSIPIKSKRKLCVCHSCDNPRCVNPAHLWLGTDQQNAFDAVRKQRMVRSKRKDLRHAGATLSPEVVKRIIKLYNTGKYTQTKLAEKFNTTQALISNVMRSVQLRDYVN